MPGHRFARRILRRVHAVHHPVLAVGLEQHVLAGNALAVEGDHHLALAELVRLVRAPVPDADLPAAVLAFGDFAREVDVAQRVVLRLDGAMVHLGVGRHTLRHSPRYEHAFVLQAEVPVQGSGVVLLDDEPGQPIRSGRDGAIRFRRPGEVAHAAVGVEAVWHRVFGLPVSVSVPDP